MPHKHKRKRGENDSHYELPPTERAKPLSTSKGTLFSDDRPQRKSTKRSRSAKDDDTPAAFRRLMAFKHGIKPRSGLDDGLTKSKKKGAASTVSSRIQEAEPAPTSSIPQIRPGERMNDFSARVDAALPISRLTKKNRGEKDVDGARHPRNKVQKRQQNMQKEWRQIDARWKEKVAEAKEEADEEYNEIWQTFETGSGKKKRKRRKDGGLGEDEGDLWAGVGKVRPSASDRLVGLHDVVQDVPRFTVAPKEKMKVRNGATVQVSNIPQAAGSFKRREELNSSRRKIIEAYRSFSKKRSVVSRNNINDSQR